VYIRWYDQPRRDGFFQQAQVSQQPDPLQSNLREGGGRVASVDQSADDYREQSGRKRGAEAFREGENCPTQVPAL